MVPFRSCLGHPKMGGDFGSHYLRVSHLMPYWSWVLGRCSFVCPLVPFWVPQSEYPELLVAFENIQTLNVLKHDYFFF